MNKVVKWILIVLAVLVAFLIVEYIVFNYKMGGAKEVKLHKVD